jgi:hypothetical protein
MQFKLFTFLLALSLLTFSCKKKSDPPVVPIPEPATTTISNFVIPSKYIGDANFAISTPISNSAATITYVSDNNAIAVVKGDSIIIKGVGTVNITASQKATSTYKAATVTTVFNVLPNIYIAGDSYDSSGEKGFYWKNGSLNNLQGYGRTTGIFIQNNNDVYLAGSMNTGAIYAYPGYWKNGVQHLLSSSQNGETSAIAVLGNDVYVTGVIITFENGSTVLTGTLWKNGVVVHLQNPFACCGSTGELRANAITIHNNKIYICGTAYADSFSSGMVWDGDGKVIKALSTQHADSQTDTTSTATAMQFLGDDMYICGTTNYKGSFLTYWKNGVPTSTLNTTDNAAAYNSVATDGTDVYTAGLDESGGLAHAVVWKNNIPTLLKTNALANTVALNGKDVIVVGASYQGTDYANPSPVYWLNGTLVPLKAPAKSVATAIAIINH